MKIYTPYLYALDRSIGKLENVDVTDKIVDYSKDDIVLFTGSLLDKSEIAKRDILGKRATYVTVVPDDYSGEIDIFWQANTLLMPKSFAQEVLGREKIDHFQTIIQHLREWAYEAFETYEREKLKQGESNNEELKGLASLLYAQVVQYQYEKVKRRAFRGEEAKQIDTKYFLKYNPKAKYHQSLILRVSENNGEKSYAMIYAEGIKGKDELNRFYQEQKNDLEQFAMDMLGQRDFSFGEKTVKLQRVYDIPEAWHLILLLKDDSAKAVFKNDNIPDIENIKDFVMLKNNCDQKVLKDSRKISMYRSFLENMRTMSDDEVFLIDFSKVIVDSRNSFLINYLRGEHEDEGEAKIDKISKRRYPREILYKFYYYLLITYEDKKKKEGDVPTNLLAIITILYGFSGTVEKMDKRLVCSLYYHLRNSIVQNGGTFLKEFDEYKAPKKLSSKELEEIERCIEINAGTHPRFSDFKKYLEDNIKHRGHKQDYLTLLLSLAQNKQCEKYRFSIKEVLLKQHFDDAFSLESHIAFKEERSSSESEAMFSTFEENLPDRLFFILGANTAESMTYIDNYMLIPQLAEPESFKCLNEKLLLDLAVMFACSFYASGAKTLTKAKVLIQKTYIIKNKEEKRDWLLSVANIALGTLHECSERDPYSGRFSYFDDEKFELTYEKKLEYFIKLSPYVFDDDFITIEASRNTFNKYFKKVKITAEDEEEPEKYQPEENKYLYKIEKLERLFHPKFGYFPLLEQEIDKTEHQLGNCSELRDSADINIQIIEKLKQIEQELFLESCLKRNIKRQFVEVCEAVKMILIQNNR